MAISKNGNGTWNGTGNGMENRSGKRKVIQYIKTQSKALQSTALDVSFHHVASQRHLCFCYKSIINVAFSNKGEWNGFRGI